ncbi:hypothetical protein CERSUDRAFT_115551 [Gelatoporia subvermispora B]|uniref:Uncharacterized protein n=1 Tax=Ceriporiopsis subvermispora (strain B) TaxID=914234 RepID=M2RCI6_CERS8|nr:hypothetical protein CERSUDRAFT_115551 [Gelatoporia subvermispora B]
MTSPHFLLSCIAESPSWCCLVDRRDRRQSARCRDTVKSPSCHLGRENRKNGLAWVGLPMATWYAGRCKAYAAHWYICRQWTIRSPPSYTQQSNTMRTHVQQRLGLLGISGAADRELQLWRNHGGSQSFDEPLRSSSCPRYFSRQCPSDVPHAHEVPDYTELTSTPPMLFCLRSL